ncbi:MAG: signal peptidase II [Bacillota bacterium]|nr:signal peptidase II [Bacillota bacterium]
MEIIIIILGLILDRITKLWAVGYFKTHKDIIVIKDYFNITYLTNKGAAWGSFQNKLLFLSIITSAVVIFMIYYLIKNKKNSKFLNISMALIISGALGNLFDRIYYKYVVDFILFHFRDVYYYPVFNVADMLVVIGTILLVIYVLWLDKNED